MNDNKTIHVALVIKRNDQDGRPMTRRTPDGRELPDPMLFTHHFDQPEDVRIQFSMWDLDNMILTPLLSGTPTAEESQSFFALAHGRMQQIDSEGVVSRQEAEHMRRRIRELEIELQSLRTTQPANS